MTLISTTLSGNSEDVIGDALRSVVEHVDICLVVDTGITDRTLLVASEVAGDKLRVWSAPWRNDFAWARNEALRAATELGGTWALSIDTDERLACKVDLLGALESQWENVVLIAHDSGTYMRERVFRLPAKGKWSGPTHECFEPSSKAVLEGVAIRELPKTPEQLAVKFERDRLALVKHVSEHPDNPRWWYYLGATYADLDRWDDAVKAFDACVSRRGWNEEAAWASYRAAECLCKLNRFDEAIERCGIGLSRHAGVAELAWLAGYASWQKGDAEQAAAWAYMAVAGNIFAGAEVHRIGFRHLPGLYEGPFDVLRFALARLGDAEGARRAEELYKLALEARTASASA